MNQPLMTMKLCLKVKSPFKNEKYANSSVGARVCLMVRGGCLPGKESKYTDHVSVEQKKQEIHVVYRVQRIYSDEDG